jgi:hypothetical protein
MVVLAAGLIAASPASAQATHNFVSKCSYSHMAMDDPIVYPGVPGASHMHTFFGNTTTDAYSTVTSLRRATTTCSNADDTAAYWLPAVYQSGVMVMPNPLRAYYRVKVHDTSSVKPFPAGLKIIAGDAHATGPTGVAFWACGGGAYQNVPPTCLPGQALNLRVEFPDCWDGVHLDSADHKSHMAYSIKGFCPADHPVAMPFLELDVNYKTSGGPGLTVASGAAYTVHADFFNAWHQHTLAALVVKCLNGVQVCGQI